MARLPPGQSSSHDERIEQATVKVYGIPNCDKVRAARAWFARCGVSLVFHDFRKDAPSEALFRRWLQSVPWTELLNRASATWRKLPEPARKFVDAPARAIELMLERPALVSRPVVERKGRLEVGFRPESS